MRSVAVLLLLSIVPCCGALTNIPMCSTYGHQSKCVLDCQCRWCPEEEECANYGFTGPDCNNYTSKTHSCRKDTVVGQWVIVGIVAACVCAFLIIVAVIFSPFACVLGVVGTSILIDRIWQACSDCCAPVASWWKDRKDRATNRNEGQHLLEKV